MKDLLWLIPLLPLLGAAVNGLVGNRRGWSRRATSAVALTGSGLAMVAAFAAIIDWAASVGTAAVHVDRLFTWIPAGFGHTTDGLLANLSIDFALRIDALSAVMLFFVTFVGFLIHVYSVGYMHGEGERPYARYFAYLNLFMFAMLTLVLGANLAVMFVGWEGVGLCSYLLIGFFFEKDWCAAAGKKAFIVNRIGDFGFLLAIFWTVKVFGTVDFAALQAAIEADPARFAAAATPIALLLFVGAIGKSAQLPLYVWLPDAMAGPTPVSALIHAATMVTAGVYMVARTNFIFRLSPTAMLVVALVGGLTAVFAATIGLAQNDIKKVLAYSTVSQLGYMFLGAGAGAFGAGDLPRLHPRVLQGLPLPRRGLGDPRLLRRARTCARWAASRSTCRSRTGRSWWRRWRSPGSRLSPASSPRTRSWRRCSRPGRATCTASGRCTSCSGRSGSPARS